MFLNNYNFAGSNALDVEVDAVTLVFCCILKNSWTEAARASICSVVL